MAQTVTFVSFAAAAVGFLLFHIWKYHFQAGSLTVSIRLDRKAPGAHVIWDVVNGSPWPVTLTKLIIYPRHHALGRGSSAESAPFSAPRRLEPQDEMLIATDVEWNVLSARAIALVADDGTEYRASRRQLTAAQEQLHRVIDRRVSSGSARDFLFGAGDLAFGAVILGLGFFMLMWVIATG
jgi:hypothetical protein